MVAVMAIMFSVWHVQTGQPTILHYLEPRPVAQFEERWVGCVQPKTSRDLQVRHRSPFSSRVVSIGQIRQRHGHRQNCGKERNSRPTSQLDSVKIYTKSEKQPLICPFTTVDYVLDFEVVSLIPNREVVLESNNSILYPAVMIETLPLDQGLTRRTHLTVTLAFRQDNAVFQVFFRQYYNNCVFILPFLLVHIRSHSPILSQETYPTWASDSKMAVPASQSLRNKLLASILNDAFEAPIHDDLDDTIYYDNLLILK